MQVLIFDLQFGHYDGRSTPKPSAGTMMASGYHKSKGDAVIFTAIPPKNFATYDIVYINNDSPDMFYMQEWLEYPNVRLIGRYWHESELYRDVKWDFTPPDISIYWEWIDGFAAKYASKRVKVLETFYNYTPVKLVQNGKLTSPAGHKILIIDEDLVKYDFDFSHITCLDIKRLRFCYPLPIEGRYQIICDLVKHAKQIDRDHLWLSINGILPKEDQIAYAKEFKKNKLGRNVKITWFLDPKTEDEWVSYLIPAMDMFETFLREGNKYLFLEIPYYKYVQNDPIRRLWIAFRRWSNFRLTNTRNNLIDRILYDNINGYDALIEIFSDPYGYRARHPKGNAITELITLIEQYPEIVYEFAKVQRGKAL
jgi:hypothetical protein